MRQLTALAIKYLMTLSALYVILNVLTDISFQAAVSMTVMLVIVTYIVGDLIVLPLTNNTTAAIADFGVTTVAIWWLSAINGRTDISFTVALVCGALIAVGEWFFHQYMNDVVHVNDPTASHDSSIDK